MFTGTLEIPAFFNFDSGPTLTFLPVIEDRVGKLVAHFTAEERPWTIDLVQADVEQLDRFLHSWLRMVRDGHDVEYVERLEESVRDFRRLYTSSDSLSGFVAWNRAQASEAVELAFKQSVEPRLLEKPVEPLATQNGFAVTARGGSVVQLLTRELPSYTPVEALQLAAWLIVGAEMAGHDRALETAMATVDAIRSA